VDAWVYEGLGIGEGDWSSRLFTVWCIEFLGPYFLFARGFHFLDLYSSLRENHACLGQRETVLSGRRFLDRVATAEWLLSCEDMAERQGGKEVASLGPDGHKVQVENLTTNF